ncbi:unnamed protein product [Angiostrongylus costaricensis]|uniref:DUF2958 domain-containing protein n=1 Tax=Angiostrongylus costaricensis TaxID=334426 RepID=A0A0R3PXA8_ANGCS|nr:unnamed protein product [Angiostrongylus costaricensis]
MRQPLKALDFDKQFRGLLFDYVHHFSEVSFPEQEAYPDVFTKVGVLFYDRAAVLFSIHERLKFDGEKKEFLFPVRLLTNAGDGAEAVRVVIKQVADNF